MIKRDSVGLGLSREIGIRRKKRVLNFHKYFLEEIREIEDSLFDILSRLNLHSASGKMLDFVGALIGEYREGRSDSDFKEGIKLRIAINTSDGSHNNIINILKAVTTATGVQIINSYPSGLLITVNTSEDAPIHILDIIVGAGITHSTNVIFPNKFAFTLLEEGDAFNSLAVLPEEEDIGTTTLMIQEEIT